MHVETHGENDRLSDSRSSPTGRKCLILMANKPSTSVAEGRHSTAALIWQEMNPNPAALAPVSRSHPLDSSYKKNKQNKTHVNRKTHTCVFVTVTQSFHSQLSLSVHKTMYVLNART